VPSGSHNSRGRKFAITAGIPPMWSACAWVSAMASSREIPRAHKYGETTSSPMSSCECIQNGKPPASTISFRPSGKTKKMESP
jgi:hypothetical protein